MNQQLISKYLTYLRQQRHDTQETLAKELGISRQAVSKWETGTSLPDLETLLKLSKLYHLTINQILEPCVEHELKDFEDIMLVNPETLKEILSSFEKTDLVKASMGASPTTCLLLKDLFQEIDFAKYRESIGCVRVEEIEAIHTQIISMLNVHHLSIHTQTN